MKNSQIIASIDFDLLRFLRDSRPNEAEVLAWLGPSAAGRYHVLRKAGLVELVDDCVRLSPAHLSNDGSGFRFENHIWEIDAGTVMIIRRDRPSPSDEDSE